MFNFDPNDPRKYGLMQMALALMGSKGGNLAQNVGQAGLMGMQGYQTQRAMNAREKEEQQQAQMRQMQMEQMRQTQADQQRIAGVYSQNTMPGNLAPNDDEGNQMPQAPQGLNLEGLRGGLMAAGPAGFREAAAIQSMLPQPVKPKMAFAPNGQAVDMNALQPGTNYAKTPDWKDPAYQEFAMRRAAASRPQVTVDTRQESEFNKAVGKQQGEDYSNLMKSDAMASSQLNKLTRLEDLLASSGKTGKLTPATMELKAAADSLGFKVDHRLPFQQAAQALSNEIALSLRNPAGGAGMPGALSDRDREFLTNMVPNLAKTPEGNKELIGTMKKLATREKEVAKLARDYRKRNGKFDEGFYDELAKFSAANPLFEGVGTLSGAEQAELAELRKRFGR